MIFLCFLCLFTNFTTINAVDIVILHNTSDDIATINFVHVENDEHNEVLIATIEPNSVLEKEISIPLSPYPFTNIQEEVIDYLKIQTKKGTFFCVEGDRIETIDRTSLSFLGLWLEKQRKNPRDQIHHRILLYSQGLRRFGSPTPPPSAESTPPVIGAAGSAAAGPAEEQKTLLISLIIDTKGNILTREL